MQMEELTLRNTDFSSQQDKNPCPLQPTPRFYFPPIPGAHPDPPYPLFDHSTTSGSSGIANVNDPPWEFSYNVVHPGSFTDLLTSPLDVYGGPTGLEGIHLPQPTCEGGSNLQGETSAVVPTVPIEGESHLEASTAASSANPSCTASPGDCPTVPLREQNANADEAGTQDTSAPAIYPCPPSIGAGGPSQTLNDATWKSRNPGKPVIPVRSSEKLDAVQRAARKVTAKQRRVSQQAVCDAVAELLEEQEMRVNEIAKAHNVLLAKVKLLITRETHYRNRREESLANALVRIKARQVNADRPSGQKFQLKELQEMVANDPDMQNLDEETKQQYLGELKESRSCKSIGVRSTNTAASRDVQATLKKVYGEVG
ncbi:hypothetical protein PISMIDRAFT_18196 [Pisolithus microcarpus 441]|uniref:BZIP domain-containing protein n=1 Tax=Pisolithus microcarpus 441 TaxID=765257 RepID=A0A0C9Y882_9AGAM|nr:hypothetical protein PISMIDRAFT_18196 [Pisolithus microcarpus 441]